MKICEHLNDREYQHNMYGYDNHNSSWTSDEIDIYEISQYDWNAVAAALIQVAGNHMAREHISPGICMYINPCLLMTP